MGNNQAGATAGRAATRVVALVGPAGTGKTSLAEALLFSSGATSRQGSVEAGSSVGDASPEARARGGSTEINLMHFDYMGDHFALVELPGGTGFAADGLAALQSADLALVVIDPAPERAMLAEPVLRRLDDLGVPHAIFVNKIEHARAGTIHSLISELQPMSREPLALRQIPIREGDQVTGYVDLALERAYRYRPGKESERVEIPGELAALEKEDRTHLLETLADFDDALMEALLMDEVPDRATVMADLAADTAGNKVVPVILGSALSDGGVHRLLKLLRHEAPSPSAAAERMGVRGGGALHVFKIANGGAMGRLVLGRVLGEAIAEGDELVVEGNSERSGSLFFVQGEKTAKQAAAAPGDVVAVAKVEGARTGMMLGRKGAALAAPPEVTYPARNAAIAITTRDRKDDVKLSTALHRLCEEDPALEWHQDDASHETILRGINDEHLAVVVGRLQRRYGVAVDSHAPRTAYRESIRKNASVRGRHKKQSGGHGQYGDCVIELRPLERGEGFAFEDKITGGAIPRQYIPAVEAGIRDAMERGPLGFPVVDVAVTLVDGSFHAVDSSELAFRIAGRMAMADALAQAAPYLLEPIVRVTVDTPGGTASKAGSVLSARRGQILGLSPHPEWERWERVEALLPESAVHGLDAELRSLSQGLASFTAEFDHLAELGGKHAEEVVKARAAEAH
ncbi:MAG: elongation factor G [Novosphingobium sp.]|uniref:elongation factor G n=1 Tax=Novosphingobium sp. TaxID=1874826 RepID=UPI001DD67CCB|nr:elongation factor G [Novosphingobium sp.]MCB2056673.1 elongation factor G [Novosphingobium sp.]MCP5386549.1 elongation factor G [Novosphingobium sp.]